MAGDIRGLLGFPNAALRRFQSRFSPLIPLIAEARSFSLSAKTRSMELFAAPRSLDLEATERGWALDAQPRSLDLIAKAR